MSVDLSTATFSEICDELERRSETLVVFFQSTSGSDGENHEVRSGGNMLEIIGFAHMLIRQMERQIERENDNDD
jgi:hypothetical protein